MSHQSTKFVFNTQRLWVTAKHIPGHQSTKFVFNTQLFWWVRPNKYSHQSTKFVFNTQLNRQTNNKQNYNYKYKKNKNAQSKIKAIIFNKSFVKSIPSPTDYTKPSNSD